MKLVLIIICDEDKDRVLKKLTEQGYTPTFIASTGSFLEFGKSLFLLGVEEESLNDVKQLLQENTKRMHIKDGEELKAEMLVVKADMVKLK